jgi:2-C-methyl-D-erythritol 4-phosphate cytidylyltransferase / 2-C-methyl-D-erythritol 2,4-cyclodiphosphate synthase
MSDELAAIIVAAGRGSRAGGEIPKQWQRVAGRIVLDWTLDALRAAGLSRLVLVLHADDLARAGSLDLRGAQMVTGGATRTASVRAALEALSHTPPARVLIHDGARPLVSRAVIAGVVAALDHAQAAAPALPVVDALWRGADGLVTGPVARDGLFRAQTPQGFDFATILTAHRAHDGDAPDDVEIARLAGIGVVITAGCEDNLKLTYPADFARAERLLLERARG